MKRVVAGSVYVLLAVVIAAIAAWPIYRSSAFLILVVVSTVLAAGIAALVAWRRWSGWVAAGLLAGAVLVFGVPLAVPSRLGSPSAILRGLGELCAGLVVGWKDLLTVDLPVGSYRNLLVPALVVFLIGTTAALLLAWTPRRLGVLAVPIAIGMAWFGLLFGRTEVSASLVVGPVTFTAPVETMLGLGTLASGVLWLSWRTREERVRALRVAAASSGIRMRRVGGIDGRRAALGVGMTALAAVAALAVPAAASSLERDVLRGATGPRVEISRAVSPLTAYRAQFTDAAVERVLFSVSGADVPDRVRLAVLDSYDGAIYRTDAGDGSSSFVRLAAARSAGAGAPVDVDVVVGDLDGIWMPSAGRLAAVDFAGTRAATLADGFYVDDELDAAVQTSRWESGDSYRLRGAVAATQPLASASAPGVDDSTTPDAPASLRTWVQEHASGSDGAALSGLVALLRERGYLSHALDETQQAWMSLAGVDTFVPSASGHSLARIDQLFTALLDREQDPRAAASDNYVAAIGDDEQFAVAVSLIAHELGFPARIVVGTRMTSSDPSLSVCDEGTCRSADLAAWVEVRSSTGEWIPVDVTPQHAQSPSLEVTAQPDPTIGTAVRPDSVDEVQPPKPAQEATLSTDDHTESADLAWLWAGLRTAGIALGAVLLVTGPFLLIVLAKVLRRRSRRSSGRPAERIAGGWDEYLDAAADAGRSAPRAATRVEIADAIASPGGDELARSADEAVFSAAVATADEADEFWRIVDAERIGFARNGWQRFRAAVSLRSFLPEGRRRTSTHTERGSRADDGARRTP